MVQLRCVSVCVCVPVCQISDITWDLVHFFCSGKRRRHVFERAFTIHRILFSIKTLQLRSVWETGKTSACFRSAPFSWVGYFCNMFMSYWLKYSCKLAKCLSAWGETAVVRNLLIEIAWSKQAFGFLLKQHPSSPKDPNSSAYFSFFVAFQISIK